MMLLVTGASGVGKSTVRALIAEELAPQVRAVELTQIAGPPTYERGWRQRAVEQVVQVALAEQEAGRHLLLAGDPVPPGEVLAAPSADRLDGFAACLLDCGPDEQERRLRERGDPEDLLPPPRRLRRVDARPRPRPAPPPRGDRRRLGGDALGAPA